MKMFAGKYTLRDFYRENGKSLLMDRDFYENGCGRYKHNRFLHGGFWMLHRKIHRINKWHKLDLIDKRNKKGYCYSIICNSMPPFR